MDRSRAGSDGSGRRPPGHPAPMPRHRCRSPTPARRRSTRPVPARRSRPLIAARSWRSMTSAVIARPPLVGALADRRDRPQAMSHRAGDLAADALIGLAVVLAPLRMAEDHERRHAGQHERARLAGERAAFLGMHGLGPDGDAPSRDGAAHRLEPDGRRADHRDHRRRAIRRRRRLPAASSTASCRVGGFIFQFPATTGVRVTRPSPGRARRCAAADDSRPTG